MGKQININANSTSKSDIVYDRAAGDNLIQFSGFNGLRVDIGRNLSGTLDLGGRKFIYTDAWGWHFGSGSYAISEGDGNLWLRVNGDGTIVVTGGSGADQYSVSQSGGKFGNKLYITDFNFREDELGVGWFGNPKYLSTNESDLRLLQSSAQVVHSGAGKDAFTKIIFFSQSKDFSSEIFLPGHLDIDGIDPNAYSQSDFVILLKPATELNLSTFSLPTVDSSASSSGGSGSSPSGGSSSGNSNSASGSSYAISATTAAVAEGADLS